MIDISEQEYADNLLRTIAIEAICSTKFDEMRVPDLRKYCIHKALFIINESIRKNRGIIATQSESMGYAEWYVDYFEKVKKILENHDKQDTK